MREKLLEVLIDARYAMIDALAQPEQLAPDPVRPLFLDTWKRLAAVLRELGPALEDRAALRWLGFVAAADALAALDALGPEMNLEVSADGLRRLARVIAPDEGGDPLAAPASVDPALRDALGFDAPLPPPEPNPEVEPDEAAPVEGDESPRAPPQSSLFPVLRALLDPARWLIGEAQAATVPAEGTTGLSREALARLNRWAPLRADLPEYLPLMRTLLRTASAETARAKSLATDYRTLYGNLQLATAWQETCWRQYVRAEGALRPIRSSAGAVGLMQVNARAWRGFYDRGGLGSDVAYNARAGSEILLHYLVDLALERGEQRRPGGAENLVRAAYSAYNGGPRHLARYRSPDTPKRVRAIDDSLFKKYEAVRD
ncbi:MAG: lytic transglycosylase domain-containing protein, partial [Solirubrobacteraceae bacterium]